MRARLRMWAGRHLRRLRNRFRTVLGRWLRRFEWPVGGAAAVPALVLGYTGFAEAARAEGTALSWLDLLLPLDP